MFLHLPSGDLKGAGTRPFAHTFPRTSSPLMIEIFFFS